MLKAFFLCLAILAACATPPSDAGPDAGSPPPDGPDPRLALYAPDVRAAQAVLDVPPEWGDWMLARQDRYAFAFLLGLDGKTDWRIDVTYDAPVAYDPPWPSEDDHMAALEKMMELAYPGWTFTFGLGLPDADRVVHLGRRDVSYADTRDVYLVWEGILPHEFGHTVGLSHEYAIDADGQIIYPSDVHPPGERPCIMSRNGVTWGQTETFLLRLGPPSDAQDVDDAIDVLNHRYPPGWPK